MGRKSTGAQTTKQAVRLYLSELLKNGAIQKNKQRAGTITFGNNWNVSFKSEYSDNEKYIRLIYTSVKNKEKTHYDYKINLVEIQSNLGKGKILYFVCPVNGKHCRILYNAYNYGAWKSRTAYNNRIYYSNQLSSQLYKYNDRFWELNNLIESELKNIGLPQKRYYKDKITRTQKKFIRLFDLREKYDKLRDTVFPKFLLKAVKKQLKNI